MYADVIRCLRAAKWAIESLNNRQQLKETQKFDASQISAQAKWAKESLFNRENEKVTPSADDGT